MLPEEWFDEERASSETHPPLFLGISYHVTNTTTEEMTEDVPMDSIPTCLSKQLCCLNGAVVQCRTSNVM